MNKKIDHGLRLFGFNYRGFFTFFTELPYYVKTIMQYARLNKGDRFPLKIKNFRPILTDRGDKAGIAEGHYFHQDIWAAKKIFQKNPNKHIDIGSRIDGFISHLLSFRTVEVVDIRPITSDVEGLGFIQADATAMSGFDDDSIVSISSLHAVEHFGLGRYGDDVNPEACFLAMKSLQRVLAHGGVLYFSLPIGIERVEFNSQRVFNPLTILEAFNELKLLSFSAVNDEGEFIRNANVEDYINSDKACGLFEFTKSN
jgi:hypothetical protein